MNRWWFKPEWRIGLVLACCMLMLGCGGVTPVEQREARSPHLRRALAAKEAGDLDGAIAGCEKALRRRPNLALAHRELALILHHYREDYVGALYHYQRYLELRPDSESRGEVEELIRGCLVAFAAQIGAAPQETQRVLREKDRRLRELEVANAELRAQVAAGGQQGPAIPPAAVAAASKAAKKEGTAAPRAATEKTAPTKEKEGQTHLVQAGETLATISQKYYGTMAKWQVIFEANRDRLPNANRLRTGMELVIPAE